MIRRPISEVFEAFVDPAITCHFWYSRGSGRLKPGGKVRWDWEMFDVGTNVTVTAAQSRARSNSISLS
ncbi:SRPBCC domain-containing protein [Novosphingobium sp. CF614]|uniref:SRPBCC domain-containing protein n=1 Tax=Novosphingobium sp. CF614 TaxID=1884364 RepID=UPI0035191258